MIPKKQVVRRHFQANYRCRCRCRCWEVNTSMPTLKRMFPGSSYGSPEFVADVAVMKYRFGMHLSRQVEMADAQGVPLNRTTLANLMIASEITWFPSRRSCATSFCNSSSSTWTRHGFKRSKRRAVAQSRSHFCGSIAALRTLRVRSSF